MEKENNDLKRRLGKAMKVAEKLKKQCVVEEKVKEELVKRNDALKKRCDSQATKLQEIYEDANKIDVMLKAFRSGSVYDGNAHSLFPFLYKYLIFPYFFVLCAITNHINKSCQLPKGLFPKLYQIIRIYILMCFVSK